MEDTRSRLEARREGKEKKAEDRYSCIGMPAILQKVDLGQSGDDETLRPKTAPESSSYRRTSALPPPRSDPSTRLNTLPYEITVTILSSLPDLDTLYSLLCTSRVFHQLLLNHPSTILTEICQREFSPPALKALDLWRPKGLSPFARRHFRAFTGFGDEDPQLSPEKGYIGIAEAKRLVLDRKFVRTLIRSFNHATNHENRPSSGRCWIQRQGPYSPTEYAKIEAGIYSSLLMAQCFHSKVIAESQGEHVELHQLPMETVVDMNPIYNLPLQDHMSLVSILHQFSFLWAWLHYLSALQPPLTPTLYPRLKAKGDWNLSTWAASKKMKMAAKKYDKYAGFWIWDRWDNSKEFGNWLGNTRQMAASKNLGRILAGRERRVWTMDGSGQIVLQSLVLG